MSAVEALQGARAAGISVRIDGDGWVREASAPPPPAVLDLLSRHKAGLLTLLRPGRDGWSAEDWQGFFHERAGSAVLDEELSRANAGAQSFCSCAREGLYREPPPHAYVRC